jgi:hypothetical protein
MTSNPFQIRSFDMDENRFVANDAGANLVAFFFRTTPKTNFEQRGIRFGILDYRAFPSGFNFNRFVTEKRCS